MRLIVGDSSGSVFTYEKGNFPGDRASLIASSTELLSGAMIMRLTDVVDPAADEPLILLSDNPQDYIPWWTSDPNDARSRITLADLLSLTSGFNFSPDSTSCLSDAGITLEDCARQVYDRDVLQEPGDQFFYSDVHMEPAGYMAELASGSGFTDLFNEVIAVHLGLSATTIHNPSAANPRVGGGGQSTPDDYAEFLRAMLTGELVPTLSTFLEDRTQNVDFANRPIAVENSGDWHYGLGFWHECDQPVYDQSCADDLTISSGGAYGWTPWIDYDHRYFGLIAAEDLEAGQIGDGPAVEATRLEQQLQPLIEDILAESEPELTEYILTEGIQYAEIEGPGSNLLSLDVYEPRDASTSGPVMIMVHGGGYVEGDKAGDGGTQPPLLFPKMPYYTGLGWTFVSVNYRLTNTTLPLDDPAQVSYPEHPEDLAAAIAWVYDNIDQFNGNRDQIVLVGHSAGANLVALVGTDERLLQAQGLDLSNLTGVVALDGFYDVALQIPQGAPYLPLVFTTDEDLWREASPVFQVEPGKGIPPMLIVYNTVRADGSPEIQARAFEAELLEAGLQAEAFTVEGKTHSDLGTDLGKPGDPLSDKVDSFLADLGLE
jgi:acetyl esterase/lipase